jgi:hypothetical protein
MPPYPTKDDLRDLRDLQIEMDAGREEWPPPRRYMLAVAAYNAKLDEIRGKREQWRADRVAAGY